MPEWGWVAKSYRPIPLPAYPSKNPPQFRECKHTSLISRSWPLAPYTQVTARNTAFRGFARTHKVSRVRAHRKADRGLEPRPVEEGRALVRSVRSQWDNRLPCAQGVIGFPLKADVGREDERAHTAASSRRTASPAALQTPCTTLVGRQVGSLRPYASGCWVASRSA